MGNNVFQSPFNVTSAAINAALAGATTDLAIGRDVNTGRNVNGVNFTANASGYLFWSGRGVIRSPADASWSWRNASESIAAVTTVEANDTLAQRNGVNPQVSRIYNTYTDTSNYERGYLSWSGNVLTLGLEAVGTGNNRDININAAGTILGVTLNGITMARSGTSATSQLVAAPTGLTSTAQLAYRFAPSINQASGTYTVLDINPTETAIGAGPHYLIRGRVGGGGDVFSVDRTGAINATALALSSGNFALGPNVMTLGKRIDPSAPSANFGHFYMRDNGGGKMQFVARFPTGAIQVIATEP